MEQIDTLQINTDGGSRGNPGPSAVGVYATTNNTEVFTISEYIGLTTNNEAEYKAVIFALQYLRENSIKAQKVLFVLDSELIVKQITGLYKVKQPHLQNLKSSVLSLISELKESNKVNDVQFVHVLREKNKEADKLVNKALDSLPT